MAGTSSYGAAVSYHRPIGCGSEIERQRSSVRAGARPPALVSSAPVWAQTIKREKAIPISSVEGKDTFKEFCVSCHGEDGKGSGRAAAALKTPPPDLTKLAARSGGKFNEAAVEFAIKGDPERPHSSRDMPDWRRIFRTFSSDDNVTTLRLRNLVNYLGSIQEK